MTNRFGTDRASQIHSAADARRMARRRLPRLVFDFIDGATGREVAALANEKAFDHVTLQPRALAPTAGRDLSRAILGQAFAFPFGIAPMGMCNLVWPGADTMLARAAVALNIPLCVSSAASTTLEDMRSQAPENCWFQLYVQGSPEAALDMAARAERAGYGTLVLTVDVPEVSRRLRDLRNGFSVPFRIGPRQALDFMLHPQWTLSTLANGAPSPRNFDGGAAFDRSASRAAADWNFLDRLRESWPGKLVVKGVTAPDDAVHIREAGADAVWVSNHGGRQLDAAPPAISALPGVREAVGPDFPLIFDSGVRQGEDVVRALALGADFVMLGRPVLFAIGAAGEAGLMAFLQAIGAEIDIALAQLGLTQVGQVSDGVLAGSGGGIPLGDRPEPRLAKIG